MIVVPSKGWTVALDDSLGQLRFGVLGPLYPGQWVRRLVVMGHTTGGAGLQFAAVWLASRNTDEASVVRGRPIVDRSDRVISGVSGGVQVPAVYIESAADATINFEVPVGVRVRSGERYIGVIVGETIPAFSSEWLVSCEAVELLAGVGLTDAEVRAAVVE